MKHSAKQLACLTAIILGTTNVTEAADKGTDKQRKDTVAKIEACMQAGFRTYKYTKKEKKNEFRIRGRLKAGVREKAPVLIGGKRFVRFIKPPDSKTQHFHEVFVDDSTKGLINQFSKDITTRTGKRLSRCFGRDEVEGGTTKCDEGCLDERYDHNVCCDELSASDGCKVPRKTAQADYDYFLKEASAQCDERAKINSNFRQRLNRVLLQHHKKTLHKKPSKK